MAQRVETLLVDDLILFNTDGEEEADATQTVEFGLDGKRYKIDLNDLNADELRKTLEPYVLAASQKLPAHRRPSRTVSSRQRSADIRTWAAQEGFNVSERGRIPEAVVAEYNAAH